MIVPELGAVDLVPNHRAWHAWEAHSGRSLWKSVSLEQFCIGGVTFVYNWSWALSASWRAKHAPNWNFADWLDACPPVTSANWRALVDRVLDLLATTFYQCSWADLARMLEEAATEVLVFQQQPEDADSPIFADDKSKHESESVGVEV